MVERAICFRKKKTKNKTKTQHNNKKQQQQQQQQAHKKKTKTLEVVTVLLKSKQISSVCKPFFFTKHQSKNKRKITGLSIDVSQMARLIKPQSA